MTDFAGRELVCVRGERTVFDGLVFRVEAGGALVLTGPNGSGKSSLLRLMAGLTRPAAGVMSWNGVDIAGDPEAHRGRLHYVGHVDAVKPALTVAENIGFWAVYRGGGDGAPERTAAALDAFGMSRLADVPGRYLSAGQKRRLALARVLGSPAPLWLLDEPKTALDAEAARRVDAAIARHRDAGGMVVVSMHGGGLPDGATILDLADFTLSPKGAHKADHKAASKAAPC
jgi:heme exporter protein A